MKIQVKYVCNVYTLQIRLNEIFEIRIIESLLRNASENKKVPTYLRSYSYQIS